MTDTMFFTIEPSHEIVVSICTLCGKASAKPGWMARHVLKRSHKARTNTVTWPNGTTWTNETNTVDRAAS